MRTQKQARELFELGEDAIFEDYLNFLRSFISNANPESREDREWARLNIAQILNLITEWRSARLENMERLLADMDAAFDAHILSEWSAQPDCIFPEDHPLKLLNTSFADEAGRLFDRWVRGQLSEEESELIRNVILASIRKMWKENSCAIYLQEIITKGINYKYVEGFVKSKDKEVEIKLRAYINALWSDEKLPEEVSSAIYAISVKILSQIELNDLDIDAVNDESVRVFIYQWLHQAQNIESVLIHLSSTMELKNLSNLSEETTVAFAETVAAKIQDFLAEEEKNSNLDAFLNEAIWKYLRGPFYVLDKIELLPIFVAMSESLREEVFSPPEKRGEGVDLQYLTDVRKLWDFFQTQVVATFRMAYREMRHPKGVLSWLENNDFPQLLEIFRKLGDISIPKLSCLVRAEFSKDDSDAMSDFAARVVSVLEDSSDPIRLSAAAALATVPKVIQIALEKELESFAVKVEYLRSLPLGYKITSLAVFSETFSKIEAKLRALVPEYPARKIWPATLTRQPMQYFESLHSQDAEFAEQLMKFIDEYEEHFSIPHIRAEIKTWRTDEGRSAFFDLDAHFAKNITDNWDFLPKSLKIWFGACLSPGGPAISAYFSAWFKGVLPEKWTNSTTESFFPVLVERIISKIEGGQYFWHLAVEYFLDQSDFYFGEAFQAFLFERLKHALDKTKVKPVISNAIQGLFVEQYQKRPSTRKVKQVEIPGLREEALRSFLRLWNLAIQKYRNDSKYPSEMSDDVFEAMLDFSKKAVLEYFSEDKAELTSSIDKSLRWAQMALLVKDPKACQFLKALFIEHFYSQEGMKIAEEPLRFCAIQELCRSWKKGTAPAQEWLRWNDLPFLHDVTVFLRNYDEDFFDHFNRLSRFAMEGYFPELAAGMRVLHELETLNQTKPGDVRELKLKPFEHLSHKALCEFVRRFPHLVILDLSEMELGMDEIANLYEAARWPETLRYRNAPDFPLTAHSQIGLVNARYTTFHISHFSGLRVLDLSGSAFVQILGNSDTLEVLNLQACSQLFELSFEAPKLRGLTLTACTSLPYVQMEKYASVEIFAAEQVPQINIDMLCETYPILKPFREELKKLDEAVQRKLHERLSLAFSSFAKIEPTDDEKRQLNAIFNFIFDQVHGEPIDKNSELHALVKLLNSLWMHMRKLLNENEDYGVIFHAALEALIQYASSENYDPIQGAQLFFQLGGREVLTDFLIIYFANKLETNFALGIARLLEFADFNRRDVKETLWQLFKKREHVEVVACLLVKADEIQEDRLKELCSTILNYYNECVDALALAVLKFPAAENGVKEVFLVSYPTVGFAALKEDHAEVFLTALRALVRAGQENKAHWNFLANLAQERHTYREVILKELFQAENIFPYLSTVIWQVVRRECDWDRDSRLAALLTLPLKSLNDECGAALVEALDDSYCAEDVFFRGEILRRLGELGTTNEEIISKIPGKPWPPGYVRKFLDENLTGNDAGLLMKLVSKIYIAYPAEDDFKNTIHEILEFLLNIFYKIRANFKLEYLPSGKPTEHSEWVIFMDKMIKKFLAMPELYLSRVITIVDAMPGSFDVYLEDLASAKMQCFKPEFKDAVHNFTRRRDDYLDVGWVLGDKSRPEPKVIKVACDPFSHLSPLLDFARSKVREVFHEEMQSTGDDRLRAIFYGLDYYSCKTPPQKPVPVDSRRLLNWMKTNFAFCNAQVINWGCLLTVNEVLPAVVTIKNNKHQLQAPVVFWDAIDAPKAATIVIPVDNKTCVYQFSKQYDEEITDELKEYFHIDETHCITLPYQNPDEFGWWFLYAAFMTLHTKSVTHLDFFPDRHSINALRFFFPEIAAKPEATIPAAERPFFKRSSREEKSVSEEDDLASEEDFLNDNNASLSPR